VLGTRGQQHIQIWIAGYKIANLSTQANKPKQPVIQTSTEIEHPTVQKLAGCVLTI
jgi:hypothetical protein